MSRNKKIGLTLLLLPVLLIALSQIGYRVAAQAIANSVTEQSASAPAPTGFRVLRIALGLMTALGFIGIFTSVPAGIYFMAKHQDISQQGTVQSVADKKSTEQNPQ